MTCFLTAVSNAELRTWTAVNGKQVKAEFVSSLRGNVKLRLESGKLYDIPKDKLSKEDHEFISSLYKTDVVVGSGNKNVKNRISQIDLEPKLQVLEGIGFDLTVYKKKGSKIPFTGQAVTHNSETAKLESIINFQDGQRHGDSKLYSQGRLLFHYIYEKGKIIESTDYTDGKITGKLTFDGTLYKSKSTWLEYTANKDGQYHGLYTKWHPTGRKRQIQCQKRYINGKLVPNSEKYWNENGVRVSSLEETKSDFTKSIEKIIKDRFGD